MPKIVIDVANPTIQAAIINAAARIAVAAKKPGMATNDDVVLFTLDLMKKFREGVAQTREVPEITEVHTG